MLTEANVYHQVRRPAQLQQICKVDSMASDNKKPKSHSSLSLRLRDENSVVNWIAEVTSQDKESVRSRLHQELESPGINVAQAFAKAGLEPHVWNNDLAHFYEYTDAFIYELIIWNRNSVKRSMRRWIANYLTKYEPQGLNILTIGDGLGFDSLDLAQAGHKVTYYEVLGYPHIFANRLFAYAEADISVIADAAKIPVKAFDVIVCLDVLEHVPDVPAFVSRLTGFLRPGGIFIVHAPFYMIHPANPTHLKANRKYSGCLRPYSQCGLRLIGGELLWNPLVFKKISNNVKPHRRSFARIVALRLIGFYLSLGRFSNLPFCWIDFYRRKHNKYFD